MNQIAFKHKNNTNKAKETMSKTHSQKTRLKAIIRPAMIVGVATMLAFGGLTVLHYSNHPANAEPENTQSQQAQQAMPVTVTTTQRQEAQIWSSFSGRLEAVNYAEIRPQVSGTIQEVLFQDGQEVHEGDVLFIIDTRRYNADKAQAKAMLDAAKNDAEFAQKEYNRAKSLVDSKTISKRIYDERLNALNLAKSAVKSAEAQLEQAELNLSYANIKAPFTGHVSQAEMTKGNLVEAGPNAPILTSIVSSDGIYADFDVDEKTYIQYMQLINGKSVRELNIPVKLYISGRNEPYKGTVHSFDNRIDSTTGTIRTRALFSNDDKTLLPGMFARVEIGRPSSENFIMVSEKAIGTNQDRKFVYTVNSENIVEYRPVELGTRVGSDRIILSGLSEGEQVITEGIIRIRPGMPVMPQTM